MQIKVDTGFVKQKAYDPTKGMESLVTVPISKVRDDITLLHISTLNIFMYVTRLRHCKEQVEPAEQVMNILHE